MSTLFRTLYRSIFVLFIIITPFVAHADKETCESCIAFWNDFMYCYGQTDAAQLCMENTANNYDKNPFINIPYSKIKEWANESGDGVLICDGKLPDYLDTPSECGCHIGQYAEIKENELYCHTCRSEWNCDGTTGIQQCASGHVKATIYSTEYCCKSRYSQFGTGYLERECYKIDLGTAIYTQYNCDYLNSYYAPRGMAYVNCPGGTNASKCSGCSVCKTTYAYGNSTTAGYVPYMKTAHSTTTDKAYTTIGTCPTTTNSYVCDAGYYKSGTTITASSGCSQCPQIGSNTLSSYGATIVSGVDYSGDASLGTSPDNHTGGIDSCYASSGSNNATFIDSIGTFYWKSQTCNYGPKQ